MTKYKYFIVQDGVSHQAPRIDFLYWVKNFSRTCFDKNGNLAFKSNYSDIWRAYNPFGVLIAWREATND